MDFFPGVLNLHKKCCFQVRVPLVDVESWRGLGLGRIISTEIFSLATELGLEKLLAEMRSDHLEAIRIFKQMGYTQEGIRTDYIKEADGHTYDLVLLGCNIHDYWQILGKKPPSQA